MFSYFYLFCYHFKFSPFLNLVFNFLVHIKSGYFTVYISLSGDSVSLLLFLFFLSCCFISLFLNYFFLNTDMMWVNILINNLYKQ